MAPLRFILRVFGVVLALIWSLAIEAAVHSGSGLRGAGDGAGYGSSAANSDAIFFSIIWLIPMVPFVFAVFGPNRLDNGTMAGVIRWYANILLGVFSIAMAIFVAVKWKWFELCLIVSFLALWNYCAIKNRVQNDDAS
jgi:hypothetical protein